MNDQIKIYGHSHTIWLCGTCGVVSTCPTIVYEQHRKSGGYHFCPNGHPWGWSKETSEDEVIRRDRDRYKQLVAQWQDEAKTEREKREAAERIAAAYKGQTTRLKKRAKAGLCPCCNRHFENIQRHIATKHPDIDAEGSNVITLPKAAMGARDDADR